MQDQVSANIGIYGSPSPVTIFCVLFALLSVNACSYVFLLQIVYRVLLQVSYSTEIKFRGKSVCKNKRKNLC
jgi:hypothetical protein